MTVERRAQLQRELRAAIALLGTIDTVATAIEADPDVEVLRAVHLLLERQLDRIDRLLLDLTADRLDDERRGDQPTD